MEYLDIEIIYVADDMKKNRKRKTIGFTLLEMLLVLVIMSTLMIMLLGYVTQKADEQRRDRVTLQMQQILNAGMTYYVNNGAWPVGASWINVTASALKPTYIPATYFNPWGNPFEISSNTISGIFSVRTDVKNVGDANTVAGRLPNATVAVASTTVTANVTIPGQNLNNARSVNFSGVYHSGACVPAPNCPVPGMLREIFVVPISVNGVNDVPMVPGWNVPCNGPPSSCTVKTYPISGFTASAIPATPVRGGTGISTCSGSGTRDCAASNPGQIDSNTDYWRVCLSVTTEQGVISISDNDTGSGKYSQGLALGSVLAITRCSPPNEPSGHGFDVFMP